MCNADAEPVWPGGAVGADLSREGENARASRGKPAPAASARRRYSGVVARLIIIVTTSIGITATPGYAQPNAGAAEAGAPARLQPWLMPAPAQATYGAGRLEITPTLPVALAGMTDARVTAAVSRLLTQWQNRTGFTFPHTPEGAFRLETATSAAAALLTIEWRRAAPALPALGDEESYTLEVNASAARLQAETSTGVLRGLATLTQLLQSDGAGWCLPVVSIQDRPRFPWRGLMIDVCRHWQPIEVIKRNLDGMALVKLNVLHLHLTEDQGFRIESKTVPQLHERGSDGHYFTQDQMREIIAYAAERAIRVVPEFDMPGHATSWVVAFPDLASAPGPYVIERRWGVFDPVLDPTNEQTYAMLERFLGEMAALFPDPYLHIGGDENNGKQWNANPRIQAFIREHDLKDNAGLHAYFNRRIRDILQKHGKKLVGWDEILHPDLPKDSVVHSWRGAAGLAAAASQGYATILSNGYYIDLNYPAADHYRNDPLPADTKLTPEEQARVLGGEATMWAEWVTPEIIDSRIWPRTAAIAERLWSPREVNDVADMYRRLAIVSRRLEETGLQHERNRPAMIRRFAGEGAPGAVVAALSQVIDAIEPVKQYERGGQQRDVTQLSPLTGLADCARPESNASREFRHHVDRYLTAADEGERKKELPFVQGVLMDWRRNALYVGEFGPKHSARIAAETVPIVTALAKVSALGLDALQGTPTDEAWRSAARETLQANAKPGYGVLLPMAADVARLVEATGRAGRETPTSNVGH